jgi:hypothetical protein
MAGGGTVGRPATVTTRSPRGDWRMPSDASSAVWLAELRRNVPAG